MRFTAKYGGYMRRSGLDESEAFLMGGFLCRYFMGL